MVENNTIKVNQLLRLIEFMSLQIFRGYEHDKRSHNHVCSTVVFTIDEQPVKDTDRETLIDIDRRRDREKREGRKKGTRKRKKKRDEVVEYT